MRWETWSSRERSTGGQTGLGALKPLYKWGSMVILLSFCAESHVSTVVCSNSAWQICYACFFQGVGQVLSLPFSADDQEEKRKFQFFFLKPRVTYTSRTETYHLPSFFGLMTFCLSLLYQEANLNDCSIVNVCYFQLLSRRILKLLSFCNDK